MNHITNVKADFPLSLINERSNYLNPKESDKVVFALR